MMNESLHRQIRHASPAHLIFLLFIPHAFFLPLLNICHVASHSVSDGVINSYIHLFSLHLVLYSQVCLFLKRGASQTEVDEQGHDPLSIAVQAANADIVTLWAILILRPEMTFFFYPFLINVYTLLTIHTWEPLVEMTHWQIESHWSFPSTSNKLPQIPLNTHSHSFD